MVDPMRRGSAGFTLLELLTVLTILGVLVSVAIPSFGYLAANTKVKSASTELYLALIHARSEAIKRNRSVAVAASSGDKANWQAGWQIVVDADRDGAYDDLVVTEQGALKRVVISMADTSVVFRPTGRIAGAAPLFDLASDDPDYELKRCISADLTGRPYVKPEACP